jgi:hypothetical protein
VISLIYGLGVSSGRISFDTGCQSGVERVSKSGGFARQKKRLEAVMIGVVTPA